MCILDTVHALPGELLDFLVVLPYIKNGGIIVLHDTHLHMYHNGSSAYSKQAYATKVVLDTAVGEKIICKDSDKEHTLPNISAFMVGDDTRKYILNSFSALSMPWHYQISNHEFSIYYNFYKKIYGDDYAEYFNLARNINDMRLNQDATSCPISKKEAVKLFLQAMLPVSCYQNIKKSYKFLKKLKIKS